MPIDRGRSGIVGIVENVQLFFCYFFVPWPAAEVVESKLQNARSLLSLPQGRALGPNPGTPAP